ncbi:UDP-N-acetylmuramate:L-alanyl-gamma-D-glutamyl-meso-diaminopimelate ligase [Glaciecola sp. MH2013]|uniref:UDP-N-acetylmuramate:L-alanyl-gamma-D-glutamyl- meso-diaminopimelate ligase n=1 Tax=Glaciecola sp. MH2013 TaxID=2785524 RepID=UPI00189DC31E|nr:UDP-N-acetylmuramate:L-alanyl-gamma-D-glutamyl-meso-diaminopimelate ligase [Glaciecola sp. MH2013]MBF7073653.1 UDP-N-acetylmuramate:L-alanyl-gamma-D-glutamyl-meso-diaminopimelate ligase [Glaciecola sp. MH2013]
MHVHILGICGSFMGGIAAIAKSLGHHVTGSDTNVYPPMSTQLESLGIDLTQGFDTKQFSPTPDIVVIGNAMSRGNPAVEYVLDRNLPYTSGPQWLLDNLLKDRWVIAASGTHGKTTTSSMIAWILESTGLNPGFLIGGVPENFGVSARVGVSPFFVIEADEYDSAFFDKRSKFIHYRPRTLVINNLEFDHADIFDDLAAIKKQFHHVIRTVPSTGLVIYPEHDENVNDLIQQGCWSDIQTLGSLSNAICEKQQNAWHVSLIEADGSKFDVLHHGKLVGCVEWKLIGEHNVNNAVMAIAAAHNAGVQIADAIAALASFENVKRRMETKGIVNNIIVYDDFAHHPTAIQTTLDGLRKKVGNARIIAILEPRSNTMKMGVHKYTLAQSWQLADEVHIFEPPNLDWSLSEMVANSEVNVHLYQNTKAIVDTVSASAKSGDHILIMSNGGFNGIHDEILAALRKN